MSFPSTFTSFTYPNPTDRLNVPSHSSVHTQIASNVGQLQTVIGLDGDNSVLGTIIGDLRSPGSGGGGHVQSANKGGTGQTSYNKGDLIVGQSSSVLVKLVAGVDGQVIQANSSAAAGINWVNNQTNKVAISAVPSVTTASVLIGEASILSVTIPGSTLGTNNGIRARVFVNELIYGTSSVLIRAQYGNNTIASLVLATNSYHGGNGVTTGFIEVNLSANQSTSVQTGNLGVQLGTDFQPRPSTLIAFAPGTTSVEGTAARTFGITMRYSSVTSGDNSTFNTNGYVVEKIT